VEAVGGFSVREELEGRLERTRSLDRRDAIEEELRGVPFPPELIYLWDIFNKIRRRKGSSGFGPSPIEGQDIESFERRHRYPLAPWEHEIVEDLDDLYMKVQGEAARSKK
jgi:hypothetical protein